MARSFSNPLSRNGPLPLPRSPTLGIYRPIVARASGCITTSTSYHGMPRGRIAARPVARESAPSSTWVTSIADAVMIAADEPFSVAVPVTVPPVRRVGAIAFASPNCSGSMRTWRSRAVKTPLDNPITPTATRWLRPERRSSTTTSPFTFSECSPPSNVAFPVSVSGRGNVIVGKRRVSRRVSRLAKVRFASRYASVSVTVASIFPATCDFSSVTSMFCARYTLLLPVQSSPKSSFPDPSSGKIGHRPANVGCPHGITVESQMQVARCDVVAAIAARLRSGKRHACSLPPHRITRELERAGQTSHVGNGWTERLGDHLQRRDIDHATLVRRILQPHERKQSVDAVKARLLLITLGDLENLESAIRPEGSSNFVGALSGREISGIPGRTHGEIAVDHADVAEAEPRSPSALFHAGLRHGVAGENPIVIPFSAGLLVEHDDRAHELHIVELELLAAQRVEAVLGPDLVRLDERRAGAVGDHDIVKRRPVKEISGDAADVDDAVAVSLNQPFDVTADPLATPVAIGDQIGGAHQQQRHHHQHLR